MMCTNPYSALIVAGIVFAFVALMHLLRLLYKTPVNVGKKNIPLWVSVVGFIVSLLLSIWMFSAGFAYIAIPVNVTTTITAHN